jgi:predicted DCC family thiol-disulfide oxidoreductase YuxK
MNSGWTSGHIALLRCLLGSWLCWHFAALVPWGPELFSNAGMIPRGSDSPLLLPVNVFAWCDVPWFVVALLVVAALASLALAAGVGARITAVGLWYISACLIGRDPLIMNPGLPYVGWILLAIAIMPRARFADHAWRMPGPVLLAAWTAMVVGYTYSGLAKLTSPSWVDGTALRHVLENPLARPSPVRDLLLTLPDALLAVPTWFALALEVMAAPLAIVARVRPWLWLALLGMHLGLMILLAFADLSMGMVMLHLFTADPAWLKPAGGKSMMYYDGACGMCHRFVRFVLAEDRAAAIAFAPLSGTTFAALPAERRRTMPDSIIVQTDDGRLLDRSRAIAQVLMSLGGAWRVAGSLLALAPRQMADGVYDAVAAIRRRWSTAPAQACPVVPPEVRARFLG